MKKSLGAMIAQLRKEKGMTQLDLANEMGVTDKAVSKWERDLSCPDLSSFPHLAEVLGTSLEELMQTQNPHQSKKKHEWEKLTLPILRCVALAMGVATFALATMNALDMKSGFAMLGLGLACLAINQLKKEED